MTRQRRWQIKMVREGKCKICAAPAVTRMFCEKHRLAANRRGRNFAQRRCGGKRRYSGAEYAGGNHATSVFHFPRWLLAKPFVLQYHPQTGNFFACCLKARTHRSALANPSRKLQSARCARQGISPKPLAPFQQTFTRVRGQAEVGNAFAITSTREKRPEKGFFIPGDVQKDTYPPPDCDATQPRRLFSNALTRAREG